MSRLPAPDREALSPEDQAVWDRIAAVRSGVRGPFGVLMNVPLLADRVRGLEDYFRFDGELPPADRELVILVTAREMEARYAWARHEHRAREEGTSPEAVAAELGPRQLVELVALAGHYSLIGLTLGAFDVPQPDDLPETYTFG